MLGTIRQIKIASMGVIFLLSCQNSQDQSTTETQPAQQVAPADESPPPPIQQPSSAAINGPVNFEEEFSDSNSEPIYKIPPMEQDDEMFFVLFNSTGSCIPDDSNPEEPYRINATPLTHHFNALKTKVDSRTEKTSASFITCFTDDRKSDELYFRSSVGRGYTINANVQDITDSILHYHRPNQTIVLIGYAYGGWLALKVANELISRGEKYFLFTIEAISKDNCRFRLSSHCRKIPKDNSVGTHQSIAENSYLWGNYYQQFTLPRSSSTKIENLPNHYNKNLFLSSHKKIIESDILWNRILKDLDTAFKSRESLSD